MLNRRTRPARSGSISLITLSLLAFPASGCKGSNVGQEDSREASAAEAAAPVCSVEALESELRSLCGYEPQVAIADLPMVRWVDEPLALHGARIVRIDREGAHERGQPSRSPSEWLELSTPAAGEDLTLALAAELPARDVADLFARLHAAGRTSFDVLVRSEDPQLPLPVARDAKLLEQLAATLPDAPSQRALELATKLQAKKDACPALGEGLAKLAGVTPEQRCPTLVEEAAAAMVACECADIDEVFTLLYAVTVGTEAPRGRPARVRVELDPAAAIQPASTATWGELASQQFVGPKPHRLWIGD